MDSSSTPVNQPDKTGIMYFVVGLIVALIPSGLQLIGVTVNIWLGGAILAVALVLMVYAFWIWERASKWHLLLRIGTITIAAVVYFLLVERQMVAEWHREHSIVGVKLQENTPQTNPQSVPPIANQAPSEPPVKVPKESGKKSNASSSGAIVQENNSGSNNTHTQVGTAQGPVAIAPGGIANAAPNFGNQTLNNFGEIPDPPLLLTDQQSSSISAALAPFRGQTVTIDVSGRMVSDPFGKKLQAAIEQAGLTVKYQAAYTVMVQGIGTPPHGLSFSFGRNRKDILNAMNDQFGKLGLVNKPITAFDLGNGDNVANVFCVFVTPLK